jgi:hypothetical protein
MFGAAMAEQVAAAFDVRNMCPEEVRTAGTGAMAEAS